MNTLQEKQSQQLVEQLSQSQIYRDYEKSFSNLTDLPLSLQPINSFQLALKNKKKENPFCALMAKTNHSCAACYELQQKLEKQAQLKPKTLKCFAGLCDTAVPIRVGENIVAFLKTGQVLLHHPSREDFTAITQKLIKWGTTVDLKNAEEAYFQSKVLNKKQHQAMVHLLTIFANHLATIANQISIQEKQTEPEPIAKARKFISEHHNEPLTLNQAAKAVNMSSYYFCKTFKTATGITFTDYLTRLRIEKAKNLLLNPNKRVIEVAFEVGFQSLSQFNRSFKKVTNQSPSHFRRALKKIP